MLLKLIPLLMATGLSAQITSQICFVSDKTKPAQSTCADIKPALRSSFAQFIATQVDPTSGPKFKGIADVLFQHLAQGLFLQLLQQYPPTAIATAQATALSAQNATQSALSNVIAAPVGIVDP